jgi:hypothetical protein
MYKTTHLWLGWIQYEQKWQPSCLNSLLALSSHLALELHQADEMVWQIIHLTVDSSAEGIAMQRYWITNKVIFRQLPAPVTKPKQKFQIILRNHLVQTEKYMG